MEQKVLKKTEDQQIFSELNVLFKEIAEKFTDPDYVSFKTAMLLHIAYLNDEKSFNAENKYTGIFTNGAFGRMALNSLNFKHISINDTIETFPYPLILISDENELDTYTKRIVEMRAENNLITYPVIFFTDNFFKPVYGEKIDYVAIIDVLENAVGCKVMAFRESDISEKTDLVQTYIFYIACLARIEALSEAISVICREQEKKAAEVFSETKDNRSISDLERLMKIQTGKAALNYTDTLTDRYNKLQEYKTRIYAGLNTLRDNYDHHIGKLINSRIPDDISSFALKIDLKYSRLSDYIGNFLSEAEYLTSTCGSYGEDIKKRALKTRENIADRAAKLSLIGTFSSGKTTLINSFLGLGKNRILKTSGKHNTAVLMKLGYAEAANDECCDLIYKDKLKWSVLKPASKDIIFHNDEKYPIKILSITQSSSDYIVRYKVMAPAGKSWDARVTFRKTTTKLLVDQNSILKPGEAFNKPSVLSVESEKSTPSSRPEINLLGNYIQNEKLKNPKLTFSDSTQITNRKSILSFLKKLYDISSDTNDKDIPFSNVISNFDKFKPEALRTVVIEGDLDCDFASFLINDQNWIKYFGSSDSTTEQKPFCELPECYMLLKELRLKIHSEFLQYCDITDTPGFGSVTEEHDATTESYIRDEPGRLIVMVKVDAKTRDAKYCDLLNKIAHIYDNNRKNEKKDVIFILNFFKNLATQDNIAHAVQEYIKELTARGFNKQNIFVCDIKGAVQNNERPSKLLGYPSYQAFYDYCVNDIITSDLSNRYAKIKSGWTDFLDQSISDIDVKIYENNQRLNNLERAKRDFKEKLSAVSSLKTDNSKFDHIKNETLDIFEDHQNNIIDAYVNKRKGVFKSIRLDEMVARLNTAQKDLNVQRELSSDNIQSYFYDLINKINYYSTNNYDCPELDEPSKPLIVLTYDSLKNLLYRANDETHWFNKGDMMYKYKNDIKEMVQKDYNTSLSRLKDYWDHCSSLFSEYQQKTVQTLERELTTLENSDTLRQEIVKLTDTKSKLMMLQNKFKIIKF